MRADRSISSNPELENADSTVKGLIELDAIRSFS